MKVPSPQEVGLPEKFDKWRGGQDEAVDVIITSKKRVVALSAPTGFGKSPAYVAAALISKIPTCIITSSKGLQDQLMEDYASVGMVDLRGRRNYQCQMKPDYTCEEGHQTRCPFKGSVSCPSSQAHMRAAASRLVVTNYDKWTSCRRFGMGMEHYQQVIFDEGHDAPDALARAMQVVLHDREIESVLKLTWPKSSLQDDMDVWKVWAAGARAVAEREMIKSAREIRMTAEPKLSLMKHHSHMRLLCQRLGLLSTCKSANWIADVVGDGFQFDPIRPAIYSEAALLLKMPKIVIVSATLRPKTLYMIGVGSKDFDFIEFPSSFDPNRCPIYYIPTMRVDARAKDLRPLWVKLDQFMSRRRDRKGIVHTISYARRDDVLSTSRYSESMMVNERGEPTSETIEQFKAAPPGTTLVSPSVGTGYDFPMDTCEWQFMCKIPFPDGRAKVIKARQKDDPEYGPYLAMQYMVQAFGRGMRSKIDQCESIIADEHLDWFMPRYGHLAPKSFHRFFRRVQNLPNPLEKL